jgi:hypothetical protein
MVIEARTYPSPFDPYPVPGVTTTPARSRSRSAKSADEVPSLVGNHT